jgi:hypothetical protein
MHSARIEMDDYAKDVVARAKLLLRDDPNWWQEARRLTYELGHGGHFKSIPICIETDMNGVTFEPFLLRGAASNCGEADMEIHAWLTRMSRRQQHTTLIGERVVATEIDERNAAFYSAEQIREQKELAELRGLDPLPLDETPELLFPEGDLQQNPCTEPNRGLILTCDTDFLSLAPMWYARYCYMNVGSGLNCIDDAPLHSVGECEVLRTGWIASADDFYVKPAATGKRAAAGASAPTPQPNEPASRTALEVYDVHRQWQIITGAKNPNTRTKEEAFQDLQRVASFVAFCAMCENDYLDGLYFVSHPSMWDAFQKFILDPLMPPLVTFHEPNMTAVVNPAFYVHFIKGCYHAQLLSYDCKTNKPPRPAAEMSYAAVSTIQTSKWKDAKRHMPKEDRLELMYERTTWCINYAFHGPQQITELLEDSIWGWRPGTIDQRV